MKPFLAIALLMLLTGCEDEEAKRVRLVAEEQARQIVLVKVCIDGTHVFRHHDGRYFTGGLFPTRVENPQTVCQGK
jgi:hypothetical protein